MFPTHSECPDVVVANTEKVSSTYGICASTRKIIISNPVSGNVAPFLTLSPKKVEKYILRKGRDIHAQLPPIVGPHLVTTIYHQTIRNGLTRKT